MVRGSGKFKTKRGGGRHFSRDMVLDHDDLGESTLSRRKNALQEDNDEGDDGDDKEGEADEEDEDEDEEDEEEEEPGSSAPQPELTRTERRELKKKQVAQKQTQKGGTDEEDEDEDLINPNHVQKKLTISDLSSAPMSRREREAAEKKATQERFWKLQAAGKTDQAKADLARLKKIKEEREAAQAKRKAEADAKAAEVEAKKAAMNGKRV